MINFYDNYCINRFKKNITDEIQQLNQQIEVIGCNRWKFLELYRILSRKKVMPNGLELVLSCEVDRTVSSLF